MQNFSPESILNNIEPTSATTVLKHSISATSNTNASWEQLTCTNFVGILICRGRFGHFPWSKIDANFLDVEPNKIWRNGISFSTGKKDCNKSSRFEPFLATMKPVSSFNERVRQGMFHRSTPRSQK